MKGTHHGASGLADGVNLIKDDDVETAVHSALWTHHTEKNHEFTENVRLTRVTSQNAMFCVYLLCTWIFPLILPVHLPHPLLFLLCVSEEFPDIGLGLSHVLVQDLGTVDDLRLSGIQHLANLSEEETDTDFKVMKRADETTGINPFTAKKES